MRDTIMHMAALVRKGAPFRSIIVLHHAVTGKSGALKAIGFDRGSFGRNSKALLAWCRGAINIAQGSADDNGTLVVACGKCSDGREFPRFAIKLDESMIYKVDPDFDFETWEGEVSGKNSTRKIVSMDTIKELCVNPIKKRNLSKPSWRKKASANPTPTNWSKRPLN